MLNIITKLVIQVYMLNIITKLYKLVIQVYIYIIVCVSNSEFPYHKYLRSVIFFSLNSNTAENN